MHGPSFPDTKEETGGLRFLPSFRADDSLFLLAYIFRMTKHSIMGTFGWDPFICHLLAYEHPCFIEKINMLGEGSLNGHFH